MSSVLPANGIVLYKRDYSENHGIYTIFTREFGKLACVCRGSRKLQSKLAPHLEGFGISELMLVFGVTRVQIIGAQYTQRFQDIFTDYQKILYISYCFELVDRFLKSGDPCATIFDELIDILFYINDHSSGLDLSVHAFGLKLLSAVGFLPELYSCVNCASVILRASQIFFIEEGGLFCAGCSSGGKNTGVKVSEHTIKLLRLAIREPFHTLSHIGIEYNIRLEFAKIVQSYINYHLGREINAVRLLITR